MGHGGAEAVHLCKLSPLKWGRIAGLAGRGGLASGPQGIQALQYPCGHCCTNIRHRQATDKSYWRREKYEKSMHTPPGYLESALTWWALRLSMLGIVMGERGVGHTCIHALMHRYA